VTRGVLERSVWAVVPAAGRGERFLAANTPRTAGTLPKQYTPLNGATVLEWSLRSLMAEPRVRGIVVVLAADDAAWPPIAARLSCPKLSTATGAGSRQESVLNGLRFLIPHAAPEDWILVHDAARPCLNAADLAALLDAISVPPCGGAVLAAPIVDTIKRERAETLETVDREGLWRALTPQVFPFAQLRQALEQAAAAGLAVTDEAQAMERLGVRPALVRGSPFNIKLTRADDLPSAAAILKMTQE
jgi:2-C-methyl-D-erythritol 4-phosphate cytidylyltransferase